MCLFSKVWPFLVFLLIQLTGCAGNDNSDILSPQVDRVDGAHQLDISLEGSLQNPAFSPDSKAILFTRFRGGYNDAASDLFIYDLESASLETLISDGNSNVNLPGSAWSDSMHSIVFSSTQAPHDEIFLIPEIGTTGSETQVTNRANKQSFEPSFSPNGKWIVFESHDTDVEDNGVITKFRTDKTSGYIDISDLSDDSRQPNWSPNGDKILFQKLSNGRWDIWTMNPDGSSKMQVTNGIGNKTDAVFSHDGNWIYFSYENDDVEVANIYRISVNGGTPVRVTNFSGYDGAPSVSPDGTKLVFESARGDPDGSAGTRIWIKDLLPQQ